MLQGQSGGGIADYGTDAANRRPHTAHGARIGAGPSLPLQQQLGNEPSIGAFEGEVTHLFVRNYYLTKTNVQLNISFWISRFS